MPKLETLTTAQPQCCATCKHWTEKKGAFCPIVRLKLVGNLETMVCSGWEREKRESFALQTWYRLGGYD